MEVIPQEKSKKRQAGEHEEPAAAKSAKSDAIVLGSNNSLVSFVNRLSNREKTALSKIAVQPGPASKLLCVITNDPAQVKQKMVDAGHDKLFIISAVVLKPLERGYMNAPFEPSKDVPLKSRHFTDKDGKPTENNKPVILASLERVELVDQQPSVESLAFCSYEDHPKEGLRTKTRGKPTDGKVGVVPPGLPISMMAYEDSCKISTPYGASPSDIRPFSVAVLSVKVKAMRQCEKGYGMSLCGIEVLQDYDVCMSAMYPPVHIYNKKSDVGEQTQQLMKRKTLTKVMDADLAFIRHTVRKPDKPDEVSEKPLVPLGACGSVFVGPNNTGLQLMLDEEHNNIYSAKVFDVHVHDGVFSARTKAAGLNWLQQLYTWMIGSKTCSVMALHDEYRMKKSEGARNMTCFIVPNFNAIFSDIGKSTLQLTPAQSQAFAETVNAKVDLLEKLEDGSCKYSGWVVHEDAVAGCKYAVIVDFSTVKNAKRTPDSEASDAPHSSHLCQIYAGMSPERGVYMCYLLKLNSKTVVSALLTGLKAESASADSMEDCSSMIALPENVNVDDVFM